MPLELMGEIDGASATGSSADRLVAEEEAELVAAAKTRDTRAFELLVERYERRIVSLAQRMTLRCHVESAWISGRRTFRGEP
jgi:hypothetical protein